MIKSFTITRYAMPNGDKMGRIFTPEKEADNPRDNSDRKDSEDSEGNTNDERDNT